MSGKQPKATGRGANLKNGPGHGRTKGALNKTTKAVKEMVVEALSRVGGAKYLAEQAVANPSAFMSLVGRVIPTELKHEGGMVIQVITGVPDKQAIKESANPRCEYLDTLENE